MGRTLLLIDNFEQVTAAAGLVRDLLDACPVAHGARHQPRGAAHLRRARVSRAAAAAAGTWSARVAVGAARIAVDRAVRPARHGGTSGFRADGQERRGRRRHLPPAGRPAAGDRACRRPREDPAAGGIASPDRTRPRVAHRRAPRHAGTAADAPPHHPVELRPAHARRTAAVPPSVGVRRRLHARGRRSRLQHGRGSGRAGARRRDVARGEQPAGAAAGRRRRAALQHAGDLPRVRPRPADRERRGRRDRARARGLHARARGGGDAGHDAGRSATRGCRSATPNTTTCASPVTTCCSAGDASWALRLAGALFRFWEQREHLTEGCDTLERVLAMPGGQAPTRERARALFASAVLSDLLSENVRAETAGERGVRHLPPVRGHPGGGHGDGGDGLAGAAARPLRRGDGAVRGDGRCCGSSSGTRSPPTWRAATRRRRPSSKATSERRAGCWRRWPAPRRRAATCAASPPRSTGSATSRTRRAITTAARRYHTQSLDIYRRIGDRWGIAGVLADLARVDIDAADYAAARASLTQALQGLPRPGTPARGGASARDAVVVRQLPVTRSRRGGAGQRGGRHPHEDRLPSPPGRTRSGFRQTLATAQSRLTPETYATAVARRAHGEPGRSASELARLSEWTQDLGLQDGLGTRHQSDQGLAALLQAYFFGSIIRRTAETRLAGTPSLRACSRMVDSSGDRYTQ